MNRGNINDPVPDIDNIGDMARNQLRLAQGDGILDRFICPGAALVKRHKMVLCDAGILELAKNIQNRFSGIIDQIDRGPLRNPDDPIERSRVKGAGADKLCHVFRYRNGKCFPGMAAGKQDAGIVPDLFAKQGCEIVLKFPADPGMQANDEYTVFLIDGGRRFGVRHDRCSFHWNHGFNRHIIMHNNA